MNIREQEIIAGRYRLVKRLGSGGFSEVWLAQDTKSNNLQVALKIFATVSGLDTEGLSIFSREYALVFNLHHAHLLKPMHYDEWEGRPYLVMPYMSEGNCSSMCGRTDESTLARFFVQMGSALHYLHSQEPPIVHQDIKPANVLLDGSGNFMLTDFGISTRIRKTLNKSMGNAQSAGTTAYMAPERFSSKLEERMAIKANDIFSLGVTAFELLTDELPYGELGGIAASNNVKPAELPEKFSWELGQLIRACLAKEPWDRPTAEFIVHSAQHYLQHGRWLLPGAGSGKQSGSADANTGRKTHLKVSGEVSSSAQTEKKRKIPLWAILVFGVILLPPLLTQGEINVILWAIFGVFGVILLGIIIIFSDISD